MARNTRRRPGQDRQHSPVQDTQNRPVKDAQQPPDQSTFNFETAIATWRSFFKQRRSFFRDDLEELELHLREHTAKLTREGLTEEEAFRRASAHLGNVVLLDDEFKGVFWSKLRHQGKLLRTLLIQLSMFSNYLKTALRNLARYKGYSALNISGLVVGLACAFLIFLWIQKELSVDQFHEHADVLYQVKINNDTGGAVTTWSNAPLPLAGVLERDFPDIDDAVPTLPIRGALAKDDHAARELGFFAGSGFFDAFTFPFLSGDPATALAKPGSIAISEALAETYFGPDWRTTENTLGAMLSLEYWQSNGGVLGKAVRVDEKKEYTVTGVFEDPPANSTLQFDFVLPVADVESRFAHLSTWGPRWFNVYVKLNAVSDGAALKDKLRPVLSENVPGAENHAIILQPFADTYLHGTFEDGRPAGGRVQRIYLIGLVGLAILLIACINFTNLLTARSNERAQEIGVRKAMGATPGALISQFLGEAVITSLIALVGAVGLMAALMPVFSQVTAWAFSLTDVSTGNGLAFFAIALATGLVAGFYPAFYLSSMKVLGMLRRQSWGKRKGSVRARGGLVVVQFTISVFLIVATLTVYRQISYLKSKDLGLDRTNVVMMELEGDLGNQFEAAREELLRSPAIESVARSSENPLGVAIMNGYVRWEGKEEGENVVFTVLDTDDALAQTMKLRLITGRFFDDERDAGGLHYVVNETAARTLGLEDPIGYPFALGYDLPEGLEGTGAGQIIGVVEDFNSGSPADQTIGPLVMRYSPESTIVLLARIAPGQTGSGIGALGAMNRQFNPDYPFEYTFLDDAYGAYYREETVIGTLSSALASVAILIACLGLLGLAAFSVQRRTKEIGVRRVMGASRQSVMVILSREFVVLVVVALAIALPTAYWAMGAWLSRFAYRIEMSAGTLVLSAGLALGVAVVTVGYQAYRATRQDPTKLLRWE